MTEFIRDPSTVHLVAKEQSEIEPTKSGRTLVKLVSRQSEGTRPATIDKTAPTETSVKSASARKIYIDAEQQSTSTIESTLTPSNLDEAARWPQAEVKVPRTRVPKDIPWEAFGSLKDDILRALKREPKVLIGNKDVLKKLEHEPELLATALELMRANASAHVRRGLPASSVTLAFLLTQRGYEPSIKDAIKRANDQVTAHVRQRAVVIATIARRGGLLSPKKLKALDCYIAGIEKQFRAFRVEVPSRSLRELPTITLEVETQMRLRPQQLFAEFNIGKINRRKAKTLKLALILAIVLDAPIPGKVLRSIDMKRHLESLDDKDVRDIIRMPAIEVANGVERVAVLSSETAHLLKQFMQSARSFLALTPSDYLFPGVKGRMTAIAFSKQFCDFMEQQFGHRYSIQTLFRLARNALLEHNPEAVEAARAWSGHSTTEMVVQTVKPLGGAQKLGVINDLIVSGKLKGR